MELATPDTRKQTQASATYDALREAILAGTFAPGERLRIRSLCAQFATGLSPMREALSRLSSERLVTQQDHRGFTVATLTPDDLEGLLRARVWLNVTGLRESIAHGAASWEEAIVLAFHRLSRTPHHLRDDSPERNPAWQAAHAAFHASLVAGCRSQWMIDFCAQLFEATERYRQMARQAEQLRTPEDRLLRSRRIDGEHRDIMTAAIARDADTAARLLEQHFERTGEVVRAVLHNLPTKSRRGPG